MTQLTKKELIIYLRMIVLGMLANQNTAPVKEVGQIIKTTFEDNFGVALEEAL